MHRDHRAPGHPGEPPRWAPAAKQGIGSAIRPTSRVWFTIAEGILTETFFPSPDSPATRDLGFLVTDAAGTYFAEEKRDAASEARVETDGVPLWCVTSTSRDGRWRLEKQIVADPTLDVLLVRVRFVPLRGEPIDAYRLYALLAPHLRGCGGGNDARVVQCKGHPALTAERGGFALALLCAPSWTRASVGYVGRSDGWQDLHRHRRMEWTYDRADDGNVAATGEIDLAAADGEVTIALGFGYDVHEAAQHALGGLQRGFDAAARDYVHDWQAWHARVGERERPPEPLPALWRASAMVLRTLEAKRFPGGSVAALATPWGFAEGDGGTLTYHVAWSRDIVECAGGILAIGGYEEAQRAVFYLRSTQEADGRWPQNMLLSGKAHWHHAELDEAALPILFVDLARRDGALRGEPLVAAWRMVRAAASYLVREGPTSPADRWEDARGLTPFTLAAEIAALITAAAMADEHGEPEPAAFLRALADAWYDAIDDWLFTTRGGVVERCGIRGYYRRLSGPGDAKQPPRFRDPDPHAATVTPDALALVRFGLRAADDPRVVDTVRAIDATLRVAFDGGPAFRRYTDDHYGETRDGAPFRPGHGIGRAWPLLTGERAHYELAAGRVDVARALLRAFESFASPCGMLPEQVWDAEDIPARGLFRGRPTGSAMPLGWAHAEYLKLARSLRDGRVYDLPQATFDRYITRRTSSDLAIVRAASTGALVRAGRRVRVLCDDACTLRGRIAGEPFVLAARDSGLGVHYADIDARRVRAADEIRFVVDGDPRERVVRFV